MVKASSARRTAWSSSAAAVAARSLSPSLPSASLLRASPSAVVPLLPAVRDAGSGGIVAEEEEEKAAEEGVVVAVREELGDAFEGQDPADGLDNKPEISKRLRSFHIV